MKLEKYKCEYYVGSGSNLNLLLLYFNAPLSDGLETD